MDGDGGGGGGRAAARPLAARCRGAAKVPGRAGPAQQRLLCCALVLLPALPRVGAQDAATDPWLEYMYVKYGGQPIDTQPDFDPNVQKYEATMDWKMRYFSVQAQPVPPAVLENIVLCRQDADCSKEEQSIVVIDFSRSITMMPGSKARFRFDVIRHGEVKTYTIVIQRLQGSETNVRAIIGRGVTLWPVTQGAEGMTPGFKPNVTSYRCLMDVAFEVMMVELHLQDGAQTVIATASPPVLLEKANAFTALKNTHPGEFKAPPLRRLLLVAGGPVDLDGGGGHGRGGWGAAASGRRLMSSDLPGEFQYPNRYANYPVPMASRRHISLKVVSADGGHFRFYSLEVARSSCPPSSPLFDVQAKSCVRFCNSGFFGDAIAGRCKSCQESCYSCFSSYRCATCPKATRELVFELVNATGLCKARQQSLIQKHPETAIALLLSVGALCIFISGLCGHCAAQGDGAVSRARPGGRQVAAAGAAEGGGDGGGLGVRRYLGRGGSASSAAVGARYMPVAGDDYDDA